MVVGKALLPIEAQIDDKDESTPHPMLLWDNAIRM